MRIPLLVAVSIMLAGAPVWCESAIKPTHISGPVLNLLSKEPGKLKDGTYYVPSTLSTISWGIIPAKESKPILTVPSGSVVTFDSLSSEGMVEDQGRNPDKFYAGYGVPPSDVLEDMRDICASDLPHSVKTDGPHVITGPVAVEGAMPGDVLKVDLLSLLPRVPYGVVASRHGRGGLPDEFPETPAPTPQADKDHPELFGSVFTFVPISGPAGKQKGVMSTINGGKVQFPIAPFLGIMGVAPDSSERLSSVPPAEFGGNLDLKELIEGSTLYLPVFVPGGKLYIGDPHFAQGNGEVALTAVEGSLRAKVRVSVLKPGDAAMPSTSTLKAPFAETPEYWIPMGLNPDLDEAMKDAIRAAIKFLVEKKGMDRATALAYLSSAADFCVSQSVDRTKGIHCRIRKSDFATVP